MLTKLHKHQTTQTLLWGPHKQGPISKTAWHLRQRFSANQRTHGQFMS